MTGSAKSGRFSPPSSYTGSCRTSRLRPSIASAVFGPPASSSRATRLAHCCQLMARPVDHQQDERDCEDGDPLRAPSWRRRPPPERCPLCRGFLLIRSASPCAPPCGSAARPRRPTRTSSSARRWRRDAWRAPVEGARCDHHHRNPSPTTVTITSDGIHTRLPAPVRAGSSATTRRASESSLSTGTPIDCAPSSRRPSPAARTWGASPRAAKGSPATSGPLSSSHVPGSSWP